MKFIIGFNKNIVPDGFEPSSSVPKTEMIDPYTTGLFNFFNNVIII
jgi:hypothetical protein